MTAAPRLTNRPVTPPRPAHLDAQLRTCTTCGRTLTGVHFPIKRERGRADRLGSRCHECVRGYSRQWYAQNAGQHKANTKADTVARAASLTALLDLYRQERRCDTCGGVEHLGLYPPDGSAPRLAPQTLADSGYAWETVLAAAEASAVRCRGCQTKREWVTRSDVAAVRTAQLDAYLLDRGCDGCASTQGLRLRVASGTPATKSAPTLASLGRDWDVIEGAADASTCVCPTCEGLAHRAPSRTHAG